MINAHDKVIQCISQFVNNYEYEVKNIIGRENIDEYMQQFGKSTSDLMYSSQLVESLYVRLFDNYELLNVSTCDSEVLMLVQNKRIVLKMISVSGISTYKTICDGIVLDEEKKNAFRETDVYLNEKHILSNRVVVDSEGQISAERYSFTFDDNSILRDKTIDIAYKNGIPSNMNIKQLNIISSDDVANEQLLIDLENVKGRIKVINDLNERCMDVLQQLIDRLQRKQIYVKK